VSCVGLEIVRTPFRAPQAKRAAERFVRTVRAERLDPLLILNTQHNGHRPRRALSLSAPERRRAAAAVASASGDARIVRRDRLDGVVHEYIVAA
jgi:putative transposase